MLTIKIGSVLIQMNEAVRLPTIVDKHYGSSVTHVLSPVMSMLSVIRTLAQYCHGADRDSSTVSAHR